MDSFTERILERARERQRKLMEYTDIQKPVQTNDLQKIKSNSQPSLSNSKLLSRKEVVSEPSLSTKTEIIQLPVAENISEGNIPNYNRHNSKTLVSSDMPGSPQQPKTLNIQRDDFNMEIKLTSSENVRVEVEIQETDDNDVEENNEGACLREDAKNRLKRLGKLYAGGEDANISSPIHRSEENFTTQDTNSNETETTSITSDAKPRRGLRRLADLAQNINQWEDEVTPRKEKEESPRKRSWKPRAPPPPVSPTKTVTDRNNASVETKSVSTNDNITKGSPQKLKWDKAVLDTLESQGFKRTESNNRLVYNYNRNPQNNSETVDEKNTTKKQQNTIKEEIEPQQTLENTPKIKSPVKTVSSPSKVNIRGAVVANKAAMFESSPNKSKDPALLSVSERKALFEKNMGAALTPKAPFGMAVPLKNETPKPSRNNAKSAIAESKNNVKPAAVENKSNIKPAVVEKPAVKKYPAPKPPVAAKSNEESVSYRTGGIASKMAALLENKTTIAQEQIESNAKEQRQKEINLLLNRFDKNKAVKENVPPEVHSESEDDEVDATETTAMITEKNPKIFVSKAGQVLTPPPLPPVPSTAEKGRLAEKRCSKGDSPKVAAVLENVKRIKVSPTKPGRLYPCLSDIETATETEPEQTNSPTPDTSLDESSAESDAANTSFGREILQAVCKNQTPQKRPIYDDSTASDLSDILDDVNDYLDEAMAHDHSGNTTGPTPPKKGKVAASTGNATQPSNSFQYKNYSPQVNSSKSGTPKTPQSPTKAVSSTRKTNDLPAYIVDGEDVLPLTHTVSFYRKQQNQISTTPIRQISRQPLEEEPENEDDGNEAVEQKIKELTEEVNKQQLMISQTSQALNLCNSTPEFMGSTEQVEAEKVLLLATHRRQAIMHEIQRLKVEGTLRPKSQNTQNIPLDKGTITISHINLPLKKEYVRALAAAGGKGHHVVCLIKCCEQVKATKLVSTVAGDSKNPELELGIPGSVVLNDVYSDSALTFEVYCLQAQEEVLPHEVKYHINSKKSNIKLTPRKGKYDSRMTKVPKESPAGPHAVRSPTFALMGYVVFSVQAINNKKHWSLNKAPSMSPLEGIVEMKVTCELDVSVEQRGFLTMFEDVSGFGAWHRRWCLLKGYTLSYWKYPDDERKLPPIDSIDLRSCITKQVGPVSREICARPNTILLERERDARSQDKDSLTTVCKGEKTIIRHLLSADTKEERNEWIGKFSLALNALRMWGK